MQFYSDFSKLFSREISLLVPFQVSSFEFGVSSSELGDRESKVSVLTRSSRSELKTRNLKLETRNFRRSMWRDFATIIVADLASFGAGELLNACSWFGLYG